MTARASTVSPLPRAGLEEHPRAYGQHRGRLHTDLAPGLRHGARSRAAHVTFRRVTDLVALCADAVSGWHGSWLTALGVPWERDDETWQALAPPHFIYFAAITLRPDTPPASV